MNKYPTQKLTSIDQWIKQKFMPGSAPSANSIRRWCREGLINSERVGRQWYIHANAKYHDDSKPSNQGVEALIARISLKL